jgi:hypothetical protein
LPAQTPLAPVGLRWRGIRCFERPWGRGQTIRSSLGVDRCATEHRRARVLAGDVARRRSCATGSRLELRAAGGPRWGTENQGRSMSDYFSDRELGPKARTEQAVSAVAWAGIVALAESLANSGASACVPLPGRPAVASHVVPPQSASLPAVAPHGPLDDALASCAGHLPPVSLPTSDRHDLRQEPYAVAPHVRICGGGAGRPASLLQLPCGVGARARSARTRSAASYLVGKQRTDTAAVHRSHLALLDPAVFQHARVQPLLDQPRRFAGHRLPTTGRSQS